MREESEHQVSVNRVILVGNLGADPELRTVGGDRAVCNLSVATNETFKGKDGARQERTEWHRVSVWGVTAENCAKFLSKGSKVYVEGRLQTRSYDKDGEKRYSTDIVAERVVFLDSKREGDRPARGGWGGGGGEGGGGDVQGDGPSSHDREEDDIPL